MFLAFGCCIRLASSFTANCRSLRTCQLPITATLVPKKTVPQGPRDLRPRETHVTIYKFIGHISLGPHTVPSWSSLQIGFVVSRNPTQAFFCMSLGELVKTCDRQL